MVNDVSGPLSDMRRDSPLEWSLVIIIGMGIVIVGSLEAYALSQGINGTIFTVAMTTIGGMIGVLGKTLHDKYKYKTEKARYRAESEWRK